MKGNAKIVSALIFVIVVVIVFCFTFRKNKENVEENNINIIVNEPVENIINKVDSNLIENNIINNEPVIENITEVKPQGTIYESNSDTGTTDKKQDAIALVKEKWGEDSTVTFRCDSISSNEEYIIAVVSKETASVKNYFKVNLVTKTVEVDY